MDALGGSGGLPLGYEAIKVPSNAPHAEQSSTRLRFGIVVSVGVHVIGEGSPIAIHDHLDPSDAGPIRRQKLLIEGVA